MKRSTFRMRCGVVATCALVVLLAGASVGLAAAGNSAMLARALAGPMADVEEIVFAARGPGRDGHWYANFGHHSTSADRMLYREGGQLCALNLRTGKLRVLLNDPRGGVRDPQVHYDGGKILLSYRKGTGRHYHLYEINTDGSGLRRITDGRQDDIEPIYLPDDDIMFCSSRVNRFVQCWFTQVAVLHRCNGDGSDVRLVSANVEQDNTPWMLGDGRVLFMRWEYVDRSRVRFHHLWTINPDGTGQHGHARRQADSRHGQGGGLLLAGSRAVRAHGVRYGSGPRGRARLEGLRTPSEQGRELARPVCLQRELLPGGARQTTVHHGRARPLGGHPYGLGGRGEARTARTAPHPPAPARTTCP